MLFYRLTKSGKNEVTKSGCRLCDFFQKFLLEELGEDYRKHWKEIRETKRGVNIEVRNKIVAAINGQKIPIFSGQNVVGQVRIVDAEHIEEFERPMERTKEDGGRRNSLLRIHPPRFTSQEDRYSDIRDGVPPIPLPVADSKSNERKPFDEAALLKTYVRTAEEINCIFAGNVSIREFIRRTCPQATTESATGYVVAHDLRSGRINLCSILKGIKDEIGNFRGTDVDRRQLLDVVSGFVTFAVNPHWVLEQRSAAAKHDIQVPTRRHTVLFEQAQSAYLLPLLTAALLDGCTQLEHAFGKPNSRQLTVDPPSVLHGHAKLDRETQLKLHFIDYLGKLDVEVDREDPDDVDAVFAELCDVVTIAVTEKRNPYFTSNKKYLDLSNVIRSDLKMEHLLLIFPGSAETTTKLITDPVFLFSHTYEIVRSISATRTAS